MSLQTIDILKGYFHTGAKPTQQQFEDLIDTLSQSSGGSSIEKANPSEAQTGTIDDKYMTPQGVKQAILALTRLANIADLSDEVQSKITAAINGLKDGVSPSLDTLKKLGDAISTLKGGVSPSFDTLKKLEDALTGKAEKTYVDNLPKVEILDNLTSTSRSKGLSARQGKILDDAKADKSNTPVTIISDTLPTEAKLGDIWIQSNGTSTKRFSDYSEALDYYRQYGTGGSHWYNVEFFRSGFTDGFRGSPRRTINDSVKDLEYERGFREGQTYKNGLTQTVTAGVYIKNKIGNEQNAWKQL